MGAMASQITGVSIVYSIVCSSADQRKHQSSASLAFVREFSGNRWIPPHKGPVTRKRVPFDDVIMPHHQPFVKEFHKRGFHRSPGNSWWIPLTKGDAKVCSLVSCGIIAILRQIKVRAYVCQSTHDMLIDLRKAFNSIWQGMHYKIIQRDMSASLAWATEAN